VVSGFFGTTMQDALKAFAGPGGLKKDQPNVERGYLDQRL